MTSDDFGTPLMLEAYMGQNAEWPWSPEEWEARAAELLDKPNFEYVAGGAGGESTVAANLEAFQRRRLRPRVLGENSERDLSVEVLGMRSPVPFFLAPIGVQSIVHAEGEMASARAAAATGVPFVYSSAATHSIEEVASALGESPHWYQLYWVSNRDLVASLVRRAEAAGHRAIVVTLDTLRLGWRDRDLRNGYLPFLWGEGIGQYTTDPVFRELAGDSADVPKEAGPLALSLFTNLGLGWKDFAWLRGETKLPILAKGILRGEDAKRAVEIGLDGVIVSNHGGRQVDGAIASLDALVEVRAAVGADLPVILDSGIRRGADVLKALALGANAVLLGRPYMYGLAVGGQAGVERVIRILSADIDVTLSLIGARSVRDLDPTWVT